MSDRLHPTEAEAAMSTKRVALPALLLILGSLFALLGCQPSGERYQLIATSSGLECQRRETVGGIRLESACPSPVILTWFDSKTGTSISCLRFVEVRVVDGIRNVVSLDRCDHYGPFDERVRAHKAQDAAALAELEEGERKANEEAARDK